MPIFPSFDFSVFHTFHNQHSSVYSEEGNVEKLTELNTVGQPLLWALGLMAPLSLHLKQGCEAVGPSRGPGIREVGQHSGQSKGHEQRSRQSWNERTGGCKPAGNTGSTHRASRPSLPQSGALVALTGHHQQVVW